jgi:hypothetical protein
MTAATSVLGPLKAKLIFIEEFSPEASSLHDNGL